MRNFHKLFSFLHKADCSVILSLRKLKWCFNLLINQLNEYFSGVEYGKINMFFL